jgi:hypothetical protein
VDEGRDLGAVYQFAGVDVGEVGDADRQPPEGEGEGDLGGPEQQSARNIAHIDATGHRSVCHGSRYQPNAADAVPATM